jgi:hypothetical protein
MTSNGKDANEVCHNGEGSSKICYVYGFQTECGREAWLKYAVDTVEAGNSNGVCIDGFQGCDPYSGSKNRTIVCNRTGAMYKCGGTMRNAGVLHAAVACPQRPVDVGAHNAYSMHRMSPGAKVGARWGGSGRGIHAESATS